MDNKNYHKGIRCTMLAREYTRQHLANHGWTISDAYNRLSAGRGLLSAKDKEAVGLYRQCAVQLRRCGMPTIKAKANVPALADWNRKRLKPWRDKVRGHINSELADLAQGKQPRYLDELRKYRGMTRTDLDTYYLLAIRDKAANELIADLLARSTAQLADCASSVPAAHPRVTYDSRYTIRCRMDEMPTFGGATGEVAVQIQDDSGVVEMDRRFSDYVRDMLNYIHDIPSTADRHLISYLEDNLNGLQRLREHLSAVADSPAMDDDTMRRTLENLDIELDSFAWPD